MKKIIILSLAVLLITASIVYAQGSQQIVGGKCEYDKTKGTCEITSVTKTEESIAQAAVGGGPGYEGCKVKFKFKPQGKDLLDKEYTMRLTNSWYPGDKFLEKYKIAEGKIFNCTMCTIKKGTCTPVVFEFPDIDTSDYFETKR